MRPVSFFCRGRTSAPRPRTTAGIVVIGDEILKGQTRDDNTHFLARRLKRLGVDLRRVSIVRDDVDEIARQVADFASSFTFVLTSGGIGPTHDDVTYRAISKAFRDDLHLHPSLINLVDKLISGTSSSSKYKLAEVPRTAKVNFPSGSENLKAAYPLVSVRNVFAFPGVPTLLRKSFDEVFADLVVSEGCSPTIVGEVFVTETELELTDRLNALVATYNKEATFGSYPEWTNNYFKTRITFESEAEDTVRKIADELGNTMSTVEYDKAASEEAMDKLDRFMAAESNKELCEAIGQSLKVVEKCFEDFAQQEVMVAVNGGKDCIVMVHLVHAHLQRWKGLKDGRQQRLRAIYIREQEPFQEVESFIDLMEAMYDLDLVKVDGPMKQALRVHSDNMKACILGMRRGDPGWEGQGWFSPTNGDWPKMMRVNPIMHWDYDQIWKFIRGLCLPYPSLYDHGYTSLGNRNNTMPNPHLKVVDGQTGRVTYKPAHQLENPDWERKGRK